MKKQNGFQAIFSKLKYLAFCTSALLFVTAAPSLEANSVYVADNGANDIAVIGTATNTVLTTFSTGSPNNPAYVAITPDGKTAYIADFGFFPGGGNTVSVVNTSNNTLITRITVGNGVFGIAITPDGKFAYVTNQVDGTVSIINTTTYAVRTIIGLTGAQLVAITPDGKFAYVTLANGVSVINTTTFAVQTLSGITSAYGIAITPDGKFVYVSNNATSGLVYVINTSSNTVVATVPVGTIPNGIAITPDGKFAYVANNGPGAVPPMGTTVSVINTSSNTVIATITVGTGPFFIAITPDGKFAYVTNQTSMNVSVINLATNMVVATIPLTSMSDPAGLAIIPVAAPQNLKGSQVNDRFGAASEYYNHLTWDPALFQVSGYHVYRNGVLIATVGPSKTQYKDHNQKKGVSTTYMVASVNAAGDESFGPTVTVK